MTRVEVVPDVLCWVRDRAGVPPETLATKFRKYPEWEAGKGGPTDRQLDELARILRVPVGMLFLPQGRIDGGTFDAAYAHQLSYLKSIAKSSGGDFYNNMGARVDPRFAAAVIGSAFEGSTLIGEALSLLGVKSTAVLRAEAQRLGVSD